MESVLEYFWFAHLGRIHFSVDNQWLETFYQGFTNFYSWAQIATKSKNS
jgi:hypothetical protein